MRRFAIAGLVLAFATVSFAQLTASERQAVADGLFLSNLELANLTKIRAEQGTAWTRKVINDPLAGIEEIQALHTSAGQRSLPQLIGLLRTTVHENPATAPAETAPQFEVPEEVPEAIRPSLKRLVGELLACSDQVRQASDKLSPAERRILIEGMPRMTSSGQELKLDFVRLPMPEPSALSNLASRVDLAKIQFAAQRLAQSIQEEVPKLREGAKVANLASKLRLTIQGVVVEIGGSGSDLHADSDAALCIDLGGDDRYSGRYGAGVGYSSALIDLGGDDVYEGPDLNFGAGVLGVGLGFDLGGQDRFRGRSLCFGAGVAGVGAFLKDGGDDDYRATALAQGFGFYGTGILLDTKGNDDYRLSSGGQGSGDKLGVGWLIDKSGDDRYSAVGLGSHPLLIGTGMASGQGYGAGPGALGVLSDLAGRDEYRGAAKAQAYGTQEGVGALADSEGIDTYVAAHEAQAASNLSGGGFLMDLGGDDAYLLRIGTGHAAAANAGVAVLIDRSGHDVYAGRGSRPGTATSNGSAVFLDSQGDDTYSGQPGIAGLARGTGSISVFADLAGTDLYGDGLDNGQAAVTPSWGTALDVIGAIGSGSAWELPQPGSKPVGNDAEMEALFARAQVNDRTALSELTAMGEPALRWLLTRKVGMGGAVPELIAWLATQIGGAAEDVCVAAIDLAKPDVARDAILACQIAGFKRAGPRVVDAIAIPEVRRTAVRAAGALAVAEAVPPLLQLAAGDETTLKRLAVIALGQIADPRGAAVLANEIESADPDHRFAAVHYFASLPDQGIPLAQRLLGSNIERTARTALELLSAIGTPDALNLIGKALTDPRKGVQIQAMVGLDGRVPREFWPAIVELRKSGDPLVKAVAARIDLGR